MTLPATLAEVDAVVGVNLRRLREDASLDRYTLALRIGLAPEDLAAAEAGRMRLAADDLTAAARHLGCDLRALFADPPPPRSLQ